MEIEKIKGPLLDSWQGSAHTGPALTPAEVLVAIHDINPDRDGLPLKKVCDLPLPLVFGLMVVACELIAACGTRKSIVILPSSSLLCISSIA